MKRLRVSGNSGGVKTARGIIDLFDIGVEPDFAKGDGMDWDEVEQIKHRVLESFRKFATPLLIKALDYYFTPKELVITARILEQKGNFFWIVQVSTTRDPDDNGGDLEFSKEDLKLIIGNVERDVEKWFKKNLTGLEVAVGYENLMD